MKGIGQGNKCGKLVERLDACTVGFMFIDLVKFPCCELAK